ncbi:MAG: Dabb family protein [Saprospiraceae bacterium]
MILKLPYYLILTALLFSNTACTKALNQNKMPENEKLLRHVVIFKFKDSSSPQDVQKVADTFADLKNKIPQIADFEWGINMSKEKLDQGFTHCFILTFKSEQDADAYQEHPAHRQFQQVLGPHMEKVFVVDYWTK